MEEKDFSRLPEPAWIQICKHLPLLDRYRVSVTCHTLNNVISDPILWRIMDIHILGHNTLIPDPEFRSSLPGWYLDIIRRFGKYVQTLTVKVSGHVCELDSDLSECLQQLSTACELQSLTFDIGIETTDFHQEHVNPPNISALQSLSSLVANARRLRHLHLRSWPVYRNIVNKECNIFKTITLNDSLKCLETLTLFMPDNLNWTVREPCLITREATYTIFSHFKHLTHIGLRAAMVSQEILNLLADPERAKLERLDVFFHHKEKSRHENVYSFPRIQPGTWQVLCDRNPEFRVHVTLSISTLTMCSDILPSPAPVASIVYLKYSIIDADDLGFLMDSHSDTLTSVKFYCGSSLPYPFIYNFCLMDIRECKNVKEFVYRGEISTHILIWTAKARGTGWKRFEVVKDKIRSTREIEGKKEVVDEDPVIVKDCDGNWTLVSKMKRRRSEQDVEEKVKKLSAKVSKILGYKWKPITKV